MKEFHNCLSFIQGPSHRLVTFTDPFNDASDYVYELHVFSIVYESVIKTVTVKFFMIKIT